MEKYQLTSKFKGYIEREDVTNVDPNYLIKGSVNVVSTDGRRVGNRKGYTLFGSVDKTNAPIDSSFDWLTRQQGARNLRVYDNGTVHLQAIFGGDYVDISTALPRSQVNFTTFWNTTEQQEVLIMVAGDKQLYTWSGGMTTFASATATTITREGTESWGESGFLLSGTRQVTIEGVVYTYTGGEGTTTLTGVTPNPTSGGHIAGDLIVQTLIVVNGKPVSVAARTAATIAFVNSNPDTITDSANGFVTAGFVAGDIITVTGSASNNSTFTIATVVAGTITLIAADSLTATGAGASITITAVRNWTNDLVGTLRNQLYVLSFNSRQYHVSEVGDYTNFSAFSVPRQVGEPALLQLDSPPSGLVVQEENMYISGTVGDWYLVTFDLSADLTGEQITVRRLKTGPQQSAINQSIMFKTKNDVMFITLEKALDSLGRIENINTPQNKPLSDPIKLLTERLDFTGGAGVYHQDFMYIALPVESVVLIYNVIEGFWEAPAILPISRFTLINGELYGHSNSVPETYKLFNGWNDDGNPINAVAQFAYQQFGTRTAKKKHNYWYTEGYIESNTNLTLRVLYDYEGSRGFRDFIINSSNAETIYSIFAGIDGGSLGKQNLGKNNIGGSQEVAEEGSLPPKFRIINTTSEQKYFEVSPIYMSNDVDFRWEILAFGPMSTLAFDVNPEIKN